MIYMYVADYEADSAGLKRKVLHSSLGRETSLGSSCGFLLMHTDGCLAVSSYQHNSGTHDRGSLEH